MRGLVISSGKIEDLKLLKALVDKNDFILCADGGIDHIKKIDKIPDLAIGDFDSISKEGLDFINSNNIKVEKFPKMKDMTDTELAIDNLIERGFKDITITGVTGSRIDHTMANILLLKRLKKEGINAKIVDDNNIIYFVDDFLRLKKTPNYISIIPINYEGVSISLKEFLYPLDKKYIPFGSTLGISNEIKGEFGTIELHKGEVLVFESRD